VSAENKFVGFEFHRVLDLKSTVFWVVPPLQSKFNDVSEGCTASIFKAKSKASINKEAAHIVAFRGKKTVLDLRLSQWWLWIMMSYGSDAL
jgi:hypothetical protein